MNNKSRLKIKLIKKFYGISGEFDEYKEKEINRIGNNAFMGLWLYFLFSNFIAFLFAVKHPIETLWVYLGLNTFIIIYIVSFYVIIASQKNKLNDVEIEKENLKPMKKKILKSGILTGLQFGIIFHLLGGLMNWATDNESFIKYITSTKNIFSSVLSAIFFGLVMYLVARFRVKSEN